MSLWLVILCGVAPCFGWMWILHGHDDHEAEPWPLVLFAMALGALSALGALWTLPWLEPLFATADPLTHVLCVTAFGEEAWKLLALLPLLAHAELDEPLDGAIYGAAVGLGFAGAENAVYAAHGADAVLMLHRAFTAMLLHAACSGCLGFCLALGKLHPRRRARRLWPWLALPAVLALLSLKLRWARARSRRYHPGL
jgi:RsiW-degrading membrane proteinase PrsW (M82 family)